MNNEIGDRDEKDRAGSTSDLHSIGLNRVIDMSLPPPKLLRSFTGEESPLAEEEYIESPIQIANFTLPPLSEYSKACGVIFEGYLNKKSSFTGMWQKVSV
jgi:hypothetical protein